MKAKKTQNASGYRSLTHQEVKCHKKLYKKEKPESSKRFKQGTHTLYQEEKNLALEKTMRRGSIYLEFKLCGRGAYGADLRPLEITYQKSPVSKRLVTTGKNEDWIMGIS